MSNAALSKAFSESVETDVDAMGAAIGLALALETDVALRQQILRLAGTPENGVLLLRLPLMENGLALRYGAAVSASYLPKGHGVSLETLLLNDVALSDALRVSQRRAAPAVMTILHPIFGLDRLPTRAEFLAFSQWSPIIEHRAYQFCARAINVLEVWRSAALTEPARATLGTDSVLRRYYGLAHAMAHLTLVTSPAAGRPWLSEMAKTFTWTTWTPSLALTRERTLWLAASAARSAAAFGAEVVDLYLGALHRAQHPTKVFDALFGLMAIACSDTRVFDDIHTAIRDARNAVTQRDLIGLGFTQIAFDSADKSLRARSAGRRPSTDLINHLGWRAGSLRGLASLEALRRDPTEILFTGEMTGLMVLPAVMDAEAHLHYSARRSVNAPLFPGPHDLHDILHRAWAPPRRPQTLH